MRKRMRVVKKGGIFGRPNPDNFDAKSLGSDHFSHCFQMVLCHTLKYECVRVVSNELIQHIDSFTKI